MYTWIVAGPDANFNNASNWVAGPSPAVPNSTSHAAEFPHFHSFSGPESVVLPSGTLALDSLRFAATSAFNASNYHFDSASTTVLSLVSGITKLSGSSNSTRLHFTSGIELQVPVAQTWNVNYLTIDGAIGGAGKLTLNPTFNPPGFIPSYFPLFRPARLNLNGPGNFEGGFEARNTEITLLHASAMAGSSITLVNSDIVAETDVTLTAPLSLSGKIHLGSDSPSGDDPPPTLAVTGAVTLASSVALSGGPVTLSGSMAETTPGTMLTIGDTVFISGSPSVLPGRFTLTGDNSTGAYTGGTFVNQQSVLLFGSAPSVPSTGLISSASTGYAGALFNTGVQASLVDRLDGVNFLGTLGLDSPSPSSPLVFSEALDLTGVAGTYRGLGSSSAAILTGAITIGAGHDYRFGGAGGHLTVSSNLSNSGSALVMDSPPGVSRRPLSVLLQGTNSFEDGVLINHGVLVFDGPNALPATGSIAFDTDTHFGYAGYTEALALTPNQFLGRVSPATFATHNVIGLDSTNPASARTVSDSIDLSLSGTVLTPYYLGTSTEVTLTGSIQPVAGVVPLTGVNGGHLRVNAPVASGSTYVEIGLPGAEGPTQGVVELNSASTHHGGATLISGTLLLGHGQALGTGRVYIEGPHTTLAATNDVVVANPIFSYSYSHPFQVGQTSSGADLTLHGFVYAPQVDYAGGGVLTLGASHSITGLTIASPGGGVVDTGPNADYWHFSEFEPYNLTLKEGFLAINTPRAALAGIESAPGTQIILHEGTKLAIFGWGGEGPDTGYDGTISGAGGLVFPSYAHVDLSGNNTFSGGSILDGDGTIGLGHSNALGTGPLKVRRGGELEATAAGVTLANSIDIERGDSSEDSFPLGIMGPLDLTLNGVISGDGGINKEGTGTLRLGGANTFAGGMYLENGTVEFAHHQAAGTGPLIFYPALGSVTAAFTTLAPVVHGLETWDSDPAVVELAANSNLTLQVERFNRFVGDIIGVGANGAQLTKTGIGHQVLLGQNTYSGGTTVSAGGLIFGEATAIPDSGLLASGLDGYIGLGDAGASVAAFLGKFDQPNTLGSIGFDTNTFSSPYFVNVPLDLTGFASSARLGSASAAVLDTGVLITPPVLNYQFGGGGGYLEVRSHLGNQVVPSAATRALIAESPALAPLTLRVTNTDNSFDGGVSAIHSAVVFAAGALPATGALTLGTGGYIGTEDPALAASTFIGRFAGATTGVIGFDNPPGSPSPRVISEAIDLSGFGTGNVALGTASPGGYDEEIYHGGVKFTGPITPGGTVYRFSGYKGGSLDVASDLSGARSVVIGTPDVLATFGDANRAITDDSSLPPYSTVILSGDNTHTGNTTLHGGQLVLGSANALGAATNALLVQSTSLPGVLGDTEMPLPKLASNLTGLLVTNPIVLNSGLRISGGRDFSLNGVLSGPGVLNLGEDDVTLRLGGNNSGFSGGIFIEDGNLHLDHDLAAGTGILSFGASDVYFNTPNPVIGGLRSANSIADVHLADGSILTINQNANTVFRGEFFTTIPELGSRLVKTGTGTLRLEGDGDNLMGLDSGEGPVTADIQQGTVVLGRDSDNPLGYGGAVKVSGGTLVLDHAELDNDLMLTSGRLGGVGEFNGQNISIGAGVTVAPGFGSGPDGNAVGGLFFTELTLAGSGTYEWDIFSLGSTDLISVGHEGEELLITATSENPFKFELTTLQGDGTPGLLDGLLTNQTYSWRLIEADEITGFDVNKFVLDTTNFGTTAAPFGTFSLSLSTTASPFFSEAIMLNFTPVPEPSTWILLVVGFGAVAVSMMRRRRL